MSFLLPFAQGFLLSLSLCLDLGMVNVAIIKTGIEKGLKPSFAVGFGSCFGDLLYMSLALLGVGAVFELLPVKWTLWLAGTATLLFLTFKMLRETWRPKANLPGSAAAAAAGKSLPRHFLTGLGLAMASPTAIAWFALVAGPIVAGMNIGHGSGLVVFAAGFFSAGLLWSLGAAWISSISGSYAGPKLVRALSFCSALLFLYFAAKVFWDGWTDIIQGGAS
ncbi:lysine transporter LysE [Paenibacillus mesophilus]|uniref:LysE family translocator n=1 Tax=Paenibacillus mesophilus TaxID=2582849 RepID=UPI00110DA3C9|nr:LysE family transporter [Paenibacillus mesophilus]TMV42654.1 lysine transporter LysE [Paenibacillus mesophilus]